MKNKEEDYATLGDIDFMEKTIKNIENKNLSSNYFNLGIFYGLFFGIIGNLFITLLFDYKLKDLSNNFKFWILIIIMMIILFFIYIIKREDREFKDKQNKIENTLHNLNLARDRISAGQKINKWGLIDTHNVVEKSLDERGLK